MRNYLIENTKEGTFHFNNRNTRTRCEICQNLTIKTPERSHWRHFVSLLLTLELWTRFTPCFRISTVRFELVNTGWVTITRKVFLH